MTVKYIWLYLLCRATIHRHLVGTLLFAFIFTAILPCLVSAQDEPLVQAQVTITEQFPTAGSLDDFTEAASTDLPAEMDQAKYNVTFFEETIWPSKVREINESDEFDICSMRNKTAHEVDFTNGGLEPYCEHVFDQIFCWAPTPPGTTVYRPCKTPFQGVNYIGNVSRTCLPNGTWEDGVRSHFECIDIGVIDSGINTHEFIQHKVLLNIGYILSLTALVGAFCIFLIFKSLRCVRNNIHWNLITSFIILYVLFYIATEMQKVVSKRDDLMWLCRILMCLINNAVLTNFFWMLIEGVYLHLLVVRAMTVRRERFWMYMIFGWGCPVIFTLLHVAGRLYFEARSNTTDPPLLMDMDLKGCWLDLSPIDYLIYGPVIACILINLAILVHVIAILVSKLRASHSFETQQYWKSVRATFILLPLLGGAYFLFIHQPRVDTVFHDVYGYFQVTLQSLQGFFVALFYVYTNQEVVMLLKRKYRRWQESHSIQVPRSSMTYHSFIPFSRKGSTDSGASRLPNKLYPPGTVPPFRPGEVVPLQCKMDCTPTLGVGIQEWASDPKGGLQLPNGSAKNGVSNGNTSTPLISSPSNGNNNDTESTPHGDIDRGDYNSNNHNDSTYTSVGPRPRSTRTKAAACFPRTRPGRQG
ncbi:hypothetical protein BSL78_26990 [Apostichopus japonicus]|uniref:Uncharacterized protein n=1 Tax=Stichopus japonicus TaxID=307972 RepID=A0A2G8JKC0_STIJA|nr:hypothetical protein BSL78_26990 [Apostichopus japonicus]